MTPRECAKATASQTFTKMERTESRTLHDHGGGGSERRWLVNDWPSMSFITSDSAPSGALARRYTGAMFG